MDTSSDLSRANIYAKQQIPEGEFCEISSGYLQGKLDL